MVSEACSLSRPHLSIPPTQHCAPALGYGQHSSSCPQTFALAVPDDLCAPCSQGLLLTEFSYQLPGSPIKHDKPALLSILSPIARPWPPLQGPGHHWQTTNFCPLTGRHPSGRLYLCSLGNPKYLSNVWHRVLGGSPRAGLSSRGLSCTRQQEDG